MTQLSKKAIKERLIENGFMGTQKQVEIILKEYSDGKSLDTVIKKNERNLSKVNPDVSIFGIDWDTDGEDVNLPKDLILPFSSLRRAFGKEFEEALKNEEISDFLTEQFGFCIRGIEEIRYEVSA